VVSLKSSGVFESIGGSSSWPGSACLSPTRSWGIAPRSAGLSRRWPWTGRD